MSDRAEGHFGEVFLQYGFAMYLANVLELRLRNILTSALILTDPDPTRDRFDELLVVNQGKTMGVLITKLIPYIQSDFGLKEELDSILILRNRLAHDFFREHYLNFLTENGRDRMLTELLSARDSFKNTHSRTDGAWEHYLKIHGATSLEDQDKKASAELEERIRREVD